MVLTLRKHVALRAESEQYPGTDSIGWGAVFHNHPPQLVSGSQRGTKKISSRDGIDCINEQFCQKRLLQIRNAANVKGLLASGLIIDRGHKNDGQIPAR